MCDENLIVSEGQQDQMASTLITLYSPMEAMMNTTFQNQEMFGLCLVSSRRSRHLVLCPTQNIFKTAYVRMQSMHKQCVSGPSKDIT